MIVPAFPARSGDTAPGEGPHRGIAGQLLYSPRPGGDDSFRFAAGTGISNGSNGGYSSWGLFPDAPTMSCRNSAVAMIKEIGINSRYYPKHYITPKRWMRNFYHVTQRMIPRYLYFELMVSIFFLILGLLNIVMFIAVGYDKPITAVLFISHPCLVIINAIFFAIMSWIFKKK